MWLWWCCRGGCTCTARTYRGKEMVGAWARALADEVEARARGHVSSAAKEEEQEEAGVVSSGAAGRSKL